MSVTKESILKALLLQEFDRMQPEMSTFEDDPMQFILRKYEGLNKTLTYLMTPSFQDYVTGIYIVAPKPTTFKIVLHNGQFFFLQFTGKTYEATVAGKGYYLMNIGEKERCMLAIARLLRYGNPLKTKGPEGAEQGTRDSEGGEETGGGEAGSEVPEATPEGGEEETIAESRILEEILKKNLTEDSDIKNDTKQYEIAATNKLNSQIEEIKKDLPEGEKFLTIIIKGVSYLNIVKAEVVPGTLNKSDIDLVDSKGNHVIFISHKDVGGAKRFARWGSFQYLYGNNSEVDNFKKNIYTFVSQNINKKDGENIDYANIENGKLVFYKGAAFSQKISSDDLKNKLVFGKKYGDENPGLNNVQLVIQGDISLKKFGEQKGVYEFDVSAAEKIWFNGEVPTGEYEPVLHAHWRGESESRGTTHNELGIENCETMARPISAIPNTEKVRSLWAPNEVLDPNIEIPKYKVKIDKKDSVLKNKEGDIAAASKDWIDKNKQYRKYFNVDEKNPRTYPGKQGIFYAIKKNADIKLVRQED